MDQQLYGQQILRTAAFRSQATQRMHIDIFRIKEANPITFIDQNKSVWHAAR